MSVNERIKKVRKALDLTQQEFGDRIGIKRNSVALIENGRNTSEQTIFAICREFNVNEEWLRNGNGEIFKAAPNTVLDALAQKYSYSHRDYVAVEKFSNLSRRERDVILNFIMEVAAGCADVEPETPALPGSDSSKLSIDEKVEAYRQALELEQRAAEKSEVS